MKFILPKMVRDGDIKMARHSKYIPVENVEDVEDGDVSSIKKDKKKYTPILLDINEGISPPKSSTSSMGVSASDPEAAAEGREASPPDPLPASAAEAFALRPPEQRRERTPRRGGLRGQPGEDRRRNHEGIAPLQPLLRRKLARRAVVPGD